MADYTITAHNPYEFTDAEILESNDLQNGFEAEVLPDDPPTPPDVALARHRALPRRVDRWVFRARDSGGKLIGAASTTRDPENDSNPDMCWFNLGVLAPHRRRGVGTRLLAEIVKVAEERGCTRLLSSTNDGMPEGPEFAKAIGADPKQAMHINHLPVAEIDRGLMERWVAEGPTRARDYDLIGWDGACPDEHVDEWIESILVMNTAPRDDLDMNDFTLTLDELREMEQMQAATATEHWVLVARHRESGQFAGHHNVTWQPSDPTTVWVNMTAVRPEHRGHALGKWLKAAMTLRILDERPQVVDIRTGNADSNDAMLGINREMGYRPMLGTQTWEVTVDEARTWLESKGVLAST